MILWVGLLRLLADFGNLIIFWRKITVLDSTVGVVHFNTCPIMEQNYTCNASHQNSWSLTVLIAQQVTTGIPYSSFIPGFYNINILGVHTTNYIHYWKNKVAYTAFRRHQNKLCMSALIWCLLYRYIYKSMPQLLNNRTVIQHLPPLQNSIWNSNSCLMPGLYSQHFPTTDTTHTFEVTSKPQHTLLVRLNKVHVLTSHTYNLQSTNTTFLTQGDNPTWCFMSVPGNALMRLLH